ncbi:hypothetical protein D3C86_1946420 [compost metagenome]
MASSRASSGRKAAIRFSPVPKQKFDSTTKSTASPRAPGPARARAAVKITQPMVLNSSRRFLRAVASAWAPISGAVRITRA